MLGDPGALRMDGGGGSGVEAGVGLGACTFSSSSTTSMCTSPRTDSPLMWVMRSPARRPASWAGLPSSTLWGWGQIAGSVAWAPELETTAQLSQLQAPSKLLPFTLPGFPDLSETSREGTGPGLGEGGQNTVRELCAHLRSPSLLLSPLPITDKDH